MFSVQDMKAVLDREISKLNFLKVSSDMSDKVCPCCSL